MRTFFLLFIAVNTLFLIGLAATQKFLWLLNIEVASTASLLITFGTFHGYRKMVEKRAATATPLADEDADILDQIDDPYQLYDDEETSESGDVKSVLKEEKARAKTRRNWGEIIRTFKGGLSPFRFLGYAALIGGFFLLLDNGFFEPISFAVGLAFVPLTAIASGFLERH